MMQIVPSYNLRDLDETDTETLFSYYLWFIYRKDNDESAEQPQDNIVYRDGKKYRKVKPQDSSAQSNI